MGGWESTGCMGCSPGIQMTPGQGRAGLRAISPVTTRRRRPRPGLFGAQHAGDFVGTGNLAVGGDSDTLLDQETVSWHAPRHVHRETKRLREPPTE